VAAAVLLALVAAAFSGVAAADFTNYDDPDYVTSNPHVRAGLTTAGVQWAVTAVAAANWHPLTWISHMLDVTAFGLAAGPHHLSSVACHALATVLLFLVLFRITGRDRASLYRSAVVAALFAIHPLHVESVAWISERKDVLSTVFWMLTLLAYSRYVARPSPGRYALVLAGLAMGLAAKPMLVTLPFVLLLLDVWPLRRWTADARVRRNLIVEKLPLIALAAASSAVTIVAQHSAGAVRDTAAIALGDRLANAVVSYWTYLAKTIWPTNLAAFYPYSDVPLVVVLLGAAGLLAISAAAFRLRFRAPYFFVGWFWYLGTLVPVIGLVQVGNQAMADRYSYVPLIGIFIAAAWGASELTKKWRAARVVLPAVAAAVVVVLVPLTHAQAATWRDSETLWRHALAVTDDNYFAHGGLGAAMLSRGDDAGAESEFRAALRIRPNLADVQNDLGSLLAGRGRVDEALQHFRQAVELDARFAEARHNLGMALWQRGRPADAIAEFTASLRINPDLPRTHNDLGRVLATSGRVADAIPHFLEAVRLAPDAIEMRYNAALALSSAGRIDEARQQLNAALALDPRHAASLELLNKIK
jgi:Flp pilus assembly protein TadD